MARILYIFPHPDDESFGPAPGIAQQLEQGHEVFLLTLTKGGATKVRHKLGLSIDEMGEVRHDEMRAVEKTLKLTGMTVLDLPDSGLKDMCPIDIEEVVKEHILKIRPDVVITYAVHGVSGFLDHLVSHAVVKRVFCEMRRQGGFAPRRLALFTLGPDSKTEGHFTLKSSAAEDIDCVLKISDEQAEAGRKALDCYETYKETIEKTGVAERVHDDIHFEFFDEDFKPPVSDITARLG